MDLLKAENTSTDTHVYLLTYGTHLTATFTLVIGENMSPLLFNVNSLIVFYKMWTISLLTTLVKCSVLLII